MCWLQYVSCGYPCKSAVTYTGDAILVKVDSIHMGVHSGGTWLFDVANRTNEIAEHVLVVACLRLSLQVRGDGYR
jgi:hypothetical protein